MRRNGYMCNINWDTTQSVMSIVGQPPANSYNFYPYNSISIMTIDYISNPDLTTMKCLLKKRTGLDQSRGSPAYQKGE